MSAVRTHEMMRSSRKKFKGGTSGFSSLFMLNYAESFASPTPKHARKEAIFLRCSRGEGVVLVIPDGQRLALLPLHAGCIYILL